MVRRTLIIAMIAAVLLSWSCSRRVESGYDAIPLVNALLTDSLPSLQRMAREAGKPSGTVVLIGDPLRCLALSEEMMNSDEFDNVDARRVKDGLPDFSGETIVSILDFANTPYVGRTGSAGGRAELREIAVRNALAALDSTCRCKVLVICSPLLAENGGEDIEDLFGKIGCDVPVIYSADSAYSLTSACFMVMRERNMFTHNISWPSARLLMTIPSSVTPPFSTVSFEDSLVPESFADTVGVFAPNTFVSYVQNKHQP